MEEINLRTPPTPKSLLSINNDLLKDMIKTIETRDIETISKKEYNDYVKYCNTYFKLLENIDIKKCNVDNGKLLLFSIILKENSVKYKIKENSIFYKSLTEHLECFKLILENELGLVHWLRLWYRFVEDYTNWKNKTRWNEFIVKSYNMKFKNGSVIYNLDWENILLDLECPLCKWNIAWELFNLMDILLSKIDINAKERGFWKEYLKNCYNKEEGLKIYFKYVLSAMRDYKPEYVEIYEEKYNDIEFMLTTKYHGDILHHIFYDIIKELEYII